MPVNGVLTNAQGSDFNLEVSLWQHLFTLVKGPYDTAAAAMGINSGVQTTRDGTITPDTLGLGLLSSDVDAPDVFKRAPCIAFSLDDGRGVKSPQALGLGDGANCEYRSVRLRCVPAMRVSGTTYEPDVKALALLKEYVWNAIGRTFVMQIVDSTAIPVANLYPQIGYALIKSADMPKRPAFRDFLIVDQRDFDVTFTLQVNVLTADGL